MSDEDVLARVHRAKEYVDQAVKVCEQVFEKSIDDKIILALEAVDGTAQDLADEAFDIHMEILVAMGKLGEREGGPASELGTRQIPIIEGV